MDYDKLFIDVPLLGKSIKHRREELGYSQEFLAEQSGLSPNHISRLECGSKIPRLETLMAIAAALDIGIEKLLDSVSETSSEFGKFCRIVPWPKGK